MHCSSLQGVLAFEVDFLPSDCQVGLSDVEAHFRAQERWSLMFPSKYIHNGSIYASIMVHPHSILSYSVHHSPYSDSVKLTEPSFYEAYTERQCARALKSYKAMNDMMIENALGKVKDMLL